MLSWLSFFVAFISFVLTVNIVSMMIEHWTKFKPLTKRLPQGPPQMIKQRVRQNLLQSWKIFPKTASSMRKICKIDIWCRNIGPCSILIEVVKDILWYCIFKWVAETERMMPITKGQKFWGAWYQILRTILLQEISVLLKESQAAALW